MAKPAKDASRLLLKAAHDLFESEDEREEFLEAMLAGDSKEMAMIILQDRPEIKSFPRDRHLKWQPPFVERISDPEFKAAKHPLYAKGAYYSLDFSSVFSASAMLAVAAPPKRVLDMCSSPGGKAVFAYRAFHPEVLLCNEIIRKRVSTLIGNLDRCKCEGSLVWSADPSVFARRYKECFDLVICDAPCSGQSLIAKGDEALGAFAPNMIDMNVGRQRRIIGNCYHCLRPGGSILYATCTFSPKENEKVIEWFLKTHPDMEAVEVPHLAEFRSRFSDFPAYRLYPHQGLGAGAFACLVRRKGETPEHYEPLGDMPAMWRYGDEVIKPRPREEIEAEKKAAKEAARPPQPTSIRDIVKKMNADRPRKPQVKKPRKRRK
ncbi:MAG: RsmB/NOP family class I SAM-dependent RNA methyltransferase [Armatimonadetes bacterium]|nr:RsmB/NOP family class I SAM-dependent RNA methyltransferase [Armatimonadota bacterium]